MGMEEGGHMRSACFPLVPPSLCEDAQFLPQNLWELDWCGMWVPVRYR